METGPYQRRKAKPMADSMTKKRQEFFFRAPEALSVQLVGDFTHWQRMPIAMKKRPDGVWGAAVELAPGTYHYRFLVDGQWRDDPECTVQVANPFGTQNMVCQVR